jgi:hypothetical protein
MVKYFIRFLVCGFGISVFGSATSGKIELKCNQVNKEINYCEISKWGSFWSKNTYGFNLQSVAIKATQKKSSGTTYSYKFNMEKSRFDEEKEYYNQTTNVSPYTLVFNTEPEIIQFATYDDSNLKEATEIEQQIQYFLEKGEKSLALKRDSTNAFGFIVGLLILYGGLFGKSYDGGLDRNHNYDDVGID